MDLDQALGSDHLTFATLFESLTDPEGRTTWITGAYDKAYLTGRAPSAGWSGDDTLTVYGTPRTGLPSGVAGTATLSGAELPRTECLKDTVARFLPYWHETIAPAVRSGRRVVIAAHGNSLRAMVKYLDELSDDAIVGLNIPTARPLVYELDEQLRPLRHYYLGDPEAAKMKATRPLTK